MRAYASWPCLGIRNVQAPLESLQKERINADEIVEATNLISDPLFFFPTFYIMKEVQIQTARVDDLHEASLLTSLTSFAILLLPLGKMAKLGKASLVDLQKFSPTSFDQALVEGDSHGPLETSQTALSKPEAEYTVSTCWAKRYN